MRLSGMRWLALALMLAPMPARADVALHDFRDLSVWKDNPDGGRHVEISRDTQRGGMRLAYTDAAPHWGNVTGPCSIPANAVALRFRLYKHSAAPNAEMFVWLFEPDGDAWNQTIRAGGKTVGAMRSGWQDVRMPVSGFGFQPRGPGSRQMTGVNRMLLGCNYGNLEVTVSDMRWETSGATTSAPLPTTPGLTPAAGKRGSIGVLDLGEPLPDGFRTAHPPSKLAPILREAGFGVTLLKAGDLANPALLTRGRFDALILPYGPYFPRAARDAFTAYLRAGGSFLTTDGYAFDKLVTWTGSGWAGGATGVTAEAMDKPTAVDSPMNTRYGTPGDAMTFREDQIGLFDPQQRCDGWVSVGGARTKAAGYSACGLIGANSPVFPPVYRRWIPLAPVLGEDGKPCGTALAIMRNYAGPYPRSSWAFSGLTNGGDLFLTTPARRQLLVDVMDRLVKGIFLHDLASQLASYRAGEHAQVSVKVTNHGGAEAKVSVKVAAGEQSSSKTLTVGPGATETVTMESPVGGKQELVALHASLTADGRQVDALEDAFCVWDDARLAREQKLEWKGNYFTLDGKPRFLAGTNQTGMMFFSPHETPATWERDFALMERAHLRILRVLHFSPFAARGYEGQASHSALDLRNRPERLCRQVDAIVQLARKHGVALFLTLHDWLPLGLPDDELAAEQDWARFWAARYRNVSGVFFDIQNEPDVDVPDRPDIVALWNRWLKERYSTDAALRAAWYRNPPEAAMPNVPLGKQTDTWDDVRTADRWRFQTLILNRWVKANVDGLRQGNPKALAAVGYLQFMHTGDRVLGTRYTDFSNQHYYAGLREFPAEVKVIDRRSYGKGFSLGEFGAMESHNARAQGEDDLHTEESVRRFQTTLRYMATMGGAFALSWDLKEMDEMVFPWGLVFRGDNTPKPWFHTWAQGAQLMEHVRPVYESPSVLLLMPDSDRVGPGLQEMYRACVRASDLLLDQRVSFGVVNEQDLPAIPKATRVLYWPLPYCPDDATFDTVAQWVRDGGVLYLSGDVAFDPTRRPTRRARRAALGLPDSAEPVSPFAAPAGTQPLVVTRVGKGQVVFAPYPLELRSDAGDTSVYARPLQLAGIAAVAVEPANAPVRVQSIATEGGGRLYLLARTDDGESPLAVSLPAAGVQTELRPYGCALIHVDGKGNVTIAESDGALRIGGVEVASAAGHFSVISLDGADLRRSGRILVLPDRQREVVVGGNRRAFGVGETAEIQR